MQSFTHHFVYPVPCPGLPGFQVAEIEGRCNVIASPEGVFWIGQIEIEAIDVVDGKLVRKHVTLDSTERTLGSPIWNWLNTQDAKIAASYADSGLTAPDLNKEHRMQQRELV